MTDLLKMVLSLSLSGTLLILVVFLLKPLWKDRLSKQWQYYIWLIVIARLVIPFAPETNLVGTIFQQLETNVTHSEQVIAEAPDMEIDMEQTPMIENTENGKKEERTPATLNPPPVQNTLPLSLYVFLIWLVIALILFVRKITIYQGFVRYIKAGREPVDEVDILNRFSILLSDAGIEKNIELATNPLISSPLFMGFFRPYIVLPNVVLAETDFCYTIRHELMHYKRRDMFYKWLVQLVTCIHWFNPFVYLMGREINRACELSCDEAVIRHMNAEEKAAYGDTLINAMEIGGNYKNALAAITLCEHKSHLKERLVSIMKYRKKSNLTLFISAILTCLLCLGATVTGATAISPAYGRNVSLSTSTIDTKTNPANLHSFKIGGTVSFGKYNNQPLKWKVLEINDGNKALLFATDVLPDTWLPFDKTSNVWETSSIRSWLNGTQKGEFLAENNFTQNERRAIIQTQISTGILGNATNDYVFLISKDEYYKYDIGNVSYDIDSFWSRTGEPDSGIDNSDIDELKKYFPNVDLENYPGSVALFASYHQASGSFNASEKGGIRPMMWIDLGALSSDGNSSVENQVNQQNDTIKTNANAESLSIAIQSTDNLISSTSGRKYMVYGPFDGSSIESVTCKLNNEVEARLEMVLSGQDKTVEGVERTNCIGFGKVYTSTLFVNNNLLNSNQQFYVFIGSDDIHNLTGTIAFSNHQKSGK